MFSFLGMSFSCQGQEKNQDWAQLQHFKEENKSVSTTTPDENRVVFMGNSITIGWLNARPSFFKGKPYVNRGISGQTTPQMLVRFRQDVIDLKPNVVVLLAGVNDIAGNTGPTTLTAIMNNIKGMVEMASVNNIKVVLCSVLPANTFSWKPEEKPADKIIALNKRIQAYAKTIECPFVDYYSVMVNNEKGLSKINANDGVHPTVAGYKIMEPLVEKGIQNALR